MPGSKKVGRNAWCVKLLYKNRMSICRAAFYPHTDFFKCKFHMFYIYLPGCFSPFELNYFELHVTCVY
jgi:hypothetical protein